MIVTVADAAPPALRAVHLIVLMPLLEIVCLLQLVRSAAGDPVSVIDQVRPTLPMNQPRLPLGEAGEVTGLTVGGVVSFACVTAFSARMKPEPQSASGWPAVSVQSIALAGLVRIALSTSTGMAGLAARIRAAIPAALGAAALVPKKGLKPGTLVATASAAARSGLIADLGRAEAVAGRVEELGHRSPRGS